jgi:hypothetical protein
VVETQEQYPKKACFSAWGDRTADLKQFALGDKLKVTFSVESREYNDRWYTDLRAYRIDLASESSWLLQHQILTKRQRNVLLRHKRHQWICLHSAKTKIYRSIMIKKIALRNQRYFFLYKFSFKLLRFEPIRLRNAYFCS